MCLQARKFFNFGVENPQNWHKNATKSPKIAIFGGVANSSPKIATLRWRPATPFVPPASFKSSQFGGIPPRLATLSDNELALVSKQQKRFVDLNVGDLLSELLGIYSRDLKKSFKYNRPLMLLKLISDDWMK